MHLPKFVADAFTDLHSCLGQGAEELKVVRLWAEGIPEDGIARESIRRLEKRLEAFRREVRHTETQIAQAK